MNVAVLMGRLTKNPDVRYSQGPEQKATARFTLAVDRRYRSDDGPTADFISCVAFGKTAEFIEKYFRKGMKMSVSGRIQTGSYTNKEGQRIFTTDVVCNEVEFVEKKAAGDGSESQAAGDVQNGKTDDDGFMNIPDALDDSLPFS
jgi:single-strand DNA-binding protein